MVTLRESKGFNRILLIFIIVLNLILAGAVVLLMNHSQNLLNSDVKINLAEIVTQNKNVITSKLMLNLDSLEAISKSVTETLEQQDNLNEDEIEKAISNYFVSGSNDELLIADKNGDILLEDGKTINISGRRYFKLAISGKANISDKVLSRANGEETFLASVPIYYKDKVVGTIQKSYTPKEMYDLFTISMFSAKGYMYVINSEGYVIMHSTHDNCHQKSDNYFRDVYEYGNSKQKNQIENDIKKNSDGFTETTIDGEQIFSAYTPLEPIHDWYLITSVPTSAVSPNGKTVINMFFVILFVVLVIFTSISLSFLWYKSKQQKQLEKIAFVDTVTGGNTYIKFIKDVEKVLESSSDKQYYILKFDIDNFKYINNFYGFEFGDELLKEINKEFTEKLTMDETVARISDDHFVAFLSWVNEERIDHLLHSTISEANVTVYFSAGVYPISDRSESINLMVDKARAVAQTVKGSMSKKFEFYTKKFDEQTTENEQLKRAVKQAIEDNELQPFYQPKVNIDTGSIVGAEALARWVTKEGKLISPAAFIPMCEKTGMITEVDMIIFEKVLKLLRRLIDEGQHCTPISINFSRLHLQDTEFLDKLLVLLEKYNIPAELVEIELTESAIFDNLDHIYDFTKNLRQHGLQISMDDFGSGYSSLNMLKDIPIDILKLDKEFLAETLDNERRNIIFSSVVEMAKKLNIKVVVEGVEYLENVELMRNCGCFIAQGYYFAKPMEETVFEKVYKEGEVK